MLTTTQIYNLVRDNTHVENIEERKEFWSQRPEFIPWLWCLLAG